MLLTQVKFRKQQKIPLLLQADTWRPRQSSRLFSQAEFRKEQKIPLILLRQNMRTKFLLWHNLIIQCVSKLSLCFCPHLTSSPLYCLFSDGWLMISKLACIVSISHPVSFSPQVLLQVYMLSFLVTVKSLFFLFNLSVSVPWRESTIKNDLKSFFKFQVFLQV